MLLWMALDACWPQMPLDTVGGGGRTRQKQLRPPWSQGHTNAALDALVSATPIPCIVGQQQPGSDTEAEEFPLSWNLGMGWPLPVSDILLLKAWAGHHVTAQVMCLPAVSDVVFSVSCRQGWGGGGHNEPELWPRSAVWSPLPADMARAAGKTDRGA